MKKLMALALAAMTAGIVTTQAAQAQAAPTVGFVDTAAVFNAYPEAKKAQDQFRKKAEDYQEELAKRQKQIEEARKAGKSDADIQKMMKDAEQDLMPQKKAVEELDRKLSTQIKAKIESAIGASAKAKGITTVVDKQVILYGGTDLTSDVVKRLK
ncbi:Outer membrane protein (OmpH-like) [compost metagenome]